MPYKMPQGVLGGDWLSLSQIKFMDGWKEKRAGPPVGGQIVCVCVGIGV